MIPKGKPDAPSKYYSQELKPPKTSRDGFCNFVQMIINDLEDNAPREALLKAVDLLDCIRAEANPYKSVTDEALTFERGIAIGRKQMAREIADRFAAIIIKEGST